MPLADTYMFRRQPPFLWSLSHLLAFMRVSGVFFGHLFSHLRSPVTFSGTDFPHPPTQSVGQKVTR